MINEIGEVIILLQRPNAIRFNQNLFRSEWIHVGFDDEPICLVRKDWREVIEDCTRRPYFDSGKILQWKKPVFNNFSKIFLNYLQNIGRWWDETFGKPLLVLPAPYFSANNDERAVRRIRLGPQFWNQPEAMSAAAESGQRWYLRSLRGLLEEFRWWTVCDLWSGSLGPDHW